MRLRGGWRDLAGGAEGGDGITGSSLLHHQGCMRVCLWRAARISASFRSSKACDRRRLRRAKRKCIPPARLPVPNSESFSFASSKSRTRRARLNSLTALSPRSHKRGARADGRFSLTHHHLPRSLLTGRPVRRRRRYTRGRNSTGRGPAGKAGMEVARGGLASQSERGREGESE